MLGHRLRMICSSTADLIRLNSHRMAECHITIEGDLAGTFVWANNHMGLLWETLPFCWARLMALISGRAMGWRWEELDFGCDIDFNANMFLKAFFDAGPPDRGLVAHD